MESIKLSTAPHNYFAVLDYKEKIIKVFCIQPPFQMFMKTKC